MTSLFLLPAEYWTDAMDIQSKKEGWILTNDDEDRIAIFKLDDPSSCSIGLNESGDDIYLEYDEPIFASDEEAMKFVIKRAVEGSKLHLLAIYLHGHPIELPVYVSPAEFLDVF